MLDFLQQGRVQHVKLLEASRHGPTIINTPLDKDDVELHVTVREMSGGAVFRVQNIQSSEHKRAFGHR